MARGPPTPGVVMVDTATVDMAATATTVDTTARGLPRPRLLPWLRLMPLLTPRPTAMVATAATAMADTVDTTVDTTARGPLMLRPMPTLTLGVAAMEAAATAARGPLMPGATAVTEATTADTATATATASK